MNSHVACKTDAKLNAATGRRFLCFSKLDRDQYRAVYLDRIYLELLGLAHPLHITVIHGRSCLLIIFWSLQLCVMRFRLGDFVYSHGDGMASD